MKGAAFVETALSRWQTLNRRERRLVGGGALLVGVLLLWFVAFEPAWVGRDRLRDELPLLRSQVAKMESLAEEARRLAEVRGQPKAAAVVRADLQRSLGAAGLGNLATVDAGTDIIRVKIDQADFDAVLDWLYGVVRDIKLRVVDVTVVRDVQPGLVTTTLSLENPRSGQ